MSDDLSKRLRAYRVRHGPVGYPEQEVAVCLEAADMIDALRAENERVTAERDDIEAERNDYRADKQEAWNLYVDVEAKRDAARKALAERENAAKIARAGWDGVEADRDRLAADLARAEGLLRELFDGDHIYGNDAEHVAVKVDAFLREREERNEGAGPGYCNFVPTAYHANCARCGRAEAEHTRQRSTGA